MEWSAGAFSVVLFALLLQVACNAVLKGSSDTLLTTKLALRASQCAER
ncbi:hypothetical protein [Paracoccus sp. Z118]|nr:hypothetical protein [Paracoccus sp. Z118]